MLLQVYWCSPLDDHDVGALVENCVWVVAVAVVDLVGVVGDVAKTQNAVVAFERRHLSSDGVVGLSDHVHGWIVRGSSKLVGKVGFSERLIVFGADKRVKVSRLVVRPVVQVLLEFERSDLTRGVLGSRILHRGVSALVDGVGAIARAVS